MPIANYLKDHNFYLYRQNVIQIPDKEEDSKLNIKYEVAKREFPVKEEFSKRYFVLTTYAADD